MWYPMTAAPVNRDLELAVQGRDGIHTPLVSCRRILTGWIASKTRERLDMSPTHWRAWKNIGSENEMS